MANVLFFGMLVNRRNSDDLDKDPVIEPALELARSALLAAKQSFLEPQDFAAEEMATFLRKKN